MGRNIKDYKQYFFEMSVPEPNTGCWIWLGTNTRKGYGRMAYLGGADSAHRISYRVFIGPVPFEAWVLHKCDTPACVNPDHLFLGDNLINIKDKMRKGRSCFAEKRKLKRAITSNLNSGQV